MKTKIKTRKNEKLQKIVKVRKQTSPTIEDYIFEKIDKFLNTEYIFNVNISVHKMKK